MYVRTTSWPASQRAWHACVWQHRLLAVNAGIPRLGSLSAMPGFALLTSFAMYVYALSCKCRVKREPSEAVSVVALDSQQRHMTLVFYPSREPTPISTANSPLFSSSSSSSSPSSTFLVDIRHSRTQHGQAHQRRQGVSGEPEAEPELQPRPRSVGPLPVCSAPQWRRRCPLG